MKKIIKKTAAVAFALTLIAGAENISFGNFYSSEIEVTAYAASNVTYDSETRTLTLSGNLTESDVSEIRNYRDAKYVIALEGTAFPSDCSSLFAGFENMRTIDLSGADTSKVTNMSSMFSSCFGLETIDLSSFDTSNVTNMNSMFACNDLKNLDLSSFDTSKVTDMNSMFSEGWFEAIDISSFNTGNVTDMQYMFYWNENLKTVYVGDSWDTSNVNISKGMFYDCGNIVGENGTTFNYQKTDKEYARVDTPETPGYFTYKSKNITKNKIKGASITLDGNIGVNFYAELMDDVTKAVISGPNGDNVITDLTSNKSDGINKFTYEVNALQSNETVTLKLYDSEDNQLDVYNSKNQLDEDGIVEYSVNAYIEDSMNYSSDAKLEKLVNTLKNYCNAADNYFNGSYNDVSDIKNWKAAQLTEYIPNFTSDDAKLSLVLNTKTALRIYMDNVNSVRISGGEYNNTKFTPQIGKYGTYFEIPDIAAHDLKTEYSLTYSLDADDFTFSPISYVYRVLSGNSSDELKDVVRAIYDYANAAAEYKIG